MLIRMLCPECGAPIPPPPAEACAYCGTRLPPTSSVRPAAPVAAVTAQVAPPPAPARPVTQTAHAEPEAPVTTFAGMTDDYVATKVQAHLGHHACLFMGANIGARKEGNAREIHAAHLPPEEAVVALWDNTVFGAADDSVVITARRVCWRDNSLCDAYMLPWRSIDPGTICALDGSTLEVRGAKMFVMSDGAARMADLLRALSTEARRLSPPRRMNAARLDESAVIERIRDALGMGASGLYYAPSVPHAKESAARESYMGPLGGERALVLFDSTVFGGADEGFALTANGVAWKRAFESPSALRYSQLDPNAVVVIEGDAPRLEVSGSRVELGIHTKTLANGLAKFLRDMAVARSRR